MSVGKRSGSKSRATPAPPQSNTMKTQFKNGPLNGSFSFILFISIVARLHSRTRFRPILSEPACAVRAGFVQESAGALT
jgi:hypothetical protein